MAMEKKKSLYSSQRTTTVTDETSKDFPILCETCLGDMPYIRMTREPYGKACKICDRPFTIFRWHAGSGGRFKKTEVCQTCAKLKNVCQTCILDLEYGLPVQVRDSVLQEHEKVALPSDETNRHFYLEGVEEKLGQGNAPEESLPYGKVTSSALLRRLALARKGPYYKRNEPHICSFFVKGECTRGVQCPFKHELPKGGELAQQNIKDRFHGHNDPVALKLLRGAKTAEQEMHGDQLRDAAQQSRDKLTASAPAASSRRGPPGLRSQDPDAEDHQKKKDSSSSTEKSPAELAAAALGPAPLPVPLPDALPPPPGLGLPTGAAPGPRYTQPSRPFYPSMSAASFESNLR